MVSKVIVSEVRHTKHLIVRKKSKEAETVEVRSEGGKSGAGYLLYFFEAGTLTASSAQT